MTDDDALHAALAWLRKQPDVRYAEVRLVDDGGERLRVRDGRPEQVPADDSRRVRSRVLGSKTWGFACSADTSEGALVATAARALAIARASAVVAQRAGGFPAQAGAGGGFVGARA